MDRVHVCLHKEKTITTGRVETASIRWEWQRLEIVETTVHPLANDMSSALLRLRSRLNVGLCSHPPRQPILQAFHPPHFLQLLNELILALVTRCDKAVTETNQGRCSDLTGTQRKYPVPIEGGAGERDINEDGRGFLRHSPMAQNEINERHRSLAHIP